MLRQLARIEVTLLANRSWPEVRTPIAIWIGMRNSDPVWLFFLFSASRTVLLLCHVNNLIYIRLSISVNLSSWLEKETAA